MRRSLKSEYYSTFSVLLWQNKPMKKETLYLIEYLAKSEKNPFYARVIEHLTSCMLYSPSSLTQTRLSTVMHHYGLEIPKDENDAQKRLDVALDAVLPSSLNEGKKALFMTLLASNFPKKKGFLTLSLELFLSQLEPVEKSIYENLLAYVSGLNRGLALFYVLAKEQTTPFTPEQLVSLGSFLHVTLCQLIFNEEELGALEEGLKSLMSVYLTLYGKYLYM